MEQNLLLVRELAGTDAVLQNPGESFARARSAERYCKETGQPLLPPATETTLCSFYQSYYKPNCLADNAARSIERYESIIRAWQIFTGNPPLASIVVGTMTVFRDAVARMPGKLGIGYVSPNTVRNYLRHLQAVLD